MSGVASNGFIAARNFFMSRHWRHPTFWYSGGYATALGRRLTGGGAGLVVTNEKLYASSHHFNMPAGANNFFELGEGFWHYPKYNNIPYNYPWRIGMTLEKFSVGGGAATGECFQGIGYGTPLTANPPFVGNGFINPWFHVIWNFTLSQWELIVSPGNSATTHKFVLNVQPVFVNGVDGGLTGGNFPHVELEWLPGTFNDPLLFPNNNTINVYIDGVLCHSVVDHTLDGVGFENTYAIMTYIAATGSNATTTLSNGGYYYPRIYQFQEFDEF